MHRFLAVAAFFAVSIAASTSSAQTIYPIDRAELLTGTRFDFKVEFFGLADPARVSVSINGEDYAKTFGKAATFIEREDGKEQSALLLRDVSLTQPGSYKIKVTDGEALGKLTIDDMPHMALVATAGTDRGGSPRTTRDGAARGLSELRRPGCRGLPFPRRRQPPSRVVVGEPPRSLRDVPAEAR
jgi:hypothetical protein